MAMPAEDAYFEIGGDNTRFWSTARVMYVPAGDATMAAWLATGRTVIQIISEQELNQTLAGVSLGELAPSNTQDQVRLGLGVILQIAFNHENRIRVLEGKTAITLAQFKAALRTQFGG